MTTPLYWHVYGSALKGTKGGKKNFPLIAAGPVPKPADEEVTNTTFPGVDGETFAYMATFEHDPSAQELDSLRPASYRTNPIPTTSKELT